MKKIQVQTRLGTILVSPNDCYFWLSSKIPWSALRKEIAVLDDYDALNRAWKGYRLPCDPFVISLSITKRRFGQLKRNRSPRVRAAINAFIDYAEKHPEMTIGQIAHAIR